MPAIEIFRDGYGIPHCYASSEDDAFFAQGYVHAEDRLWQMEYDRRRAVGRWAEVAGPRGVASDVFHRRIDLLAAVTRDLAALADGTRRMLDAYARGVNARIAEGALGREFDIASVVPAPWTPIDSLLVWRVRHLLMGSARHKLWRSVVRDVLGEDAARSMTRGLEADAITCVPPGEAVGGRPDTGGGSGADGGSNNWAIAGSRTATGMPLLAGDPHRELEVPNVYVQAHIACPEWDVLGIGMPGVPGFPHFGHNATVAWSITHAMADDQDLFEVDVERDATATRTEVIEVRSADPVEVDVVRTKHGPFIGEGLAMRWTATAETNTGFDALGPMLGATCVDELFETMRPWVEPANSLVAADRGGHIGFLTRGRIPRRKRPEAAWLPVPGDDPSYEWDGWVPFDELPRVVDPDGGFVYSANNTIAAEPYIGLDVAPPWRAQRIVDTLAATAGATIADMAALHRDLVSLAARRVAARVSWKPLEGWDGTMDRDSTAAAAYSVLRRELLEVVLERTGLDRARTAPRNRLLPGVVPEGDLWRAVEPHLHEGDKTLLAGSTWDEVVAEAKRRAEEAWHGETWGELHQVSQRHALADASLDPAPLAVDGDHDTVKVGGYVPTEGFRARTGSVARYAFDVADWDRSGWVVPLGAAGDVTAPHGTDQQQAWAAGELGPAPYTRAAVEAAAVDVLEITAEPASATSTRR